jgi:phage portal protein BeeE
MNGMFGFFRKAGGAPEVELERKSGLGGGLLALSLGAAARWGGRDTAALARSGVMQNAIAYACVRKIAAAAP